MPMLKLYHPHSGQSPWNQTFAVACSGGFDSMAVAHFFSCCQRKPLLLHVNHGTGNDAAEELVKSFAEERGLYFVAHHVNPADKDSKQSWEEFWREERMRFFDWMDLPVITGHNLDDAMETWLFGAMHGQPKLIPYNTNKIYRPFILNRKEALKQYAIKNKIPWVEDQSNTDTKYARNRIRHNIIPEVMEINKGFDTVIKKKYLQLQRGNYET
jgi:tRNA(Ile)-lysidine synthase